MNDHELIELWSELGKINYSKLNDLLAKIMKADFITSHKEMIEFSLLVLTGRKTVTYDDPEYLGLLSQNEVMDFVRQFFYAIDPSIHKMFCDKLDESAREESTIHISTKNNGNVNEKSCVDGNGNVNIALEGTTKDIVSTIHEMVHNFTIIPSKCGLIGSIFAETPAVTMELLLYDYIKWLSDSGKIDRTIFEDIEKFIKWRFARTILHAQTLLLSCILIDLYKSNNNHIDQNIIFRYLRTLDDDDFKNRIIKSRFVDLLKSIDAKDYQKYTYIVSLRYVVGLLTACDFYTNISRDPNEIKSLFKLSSILCHSDETIDDDLAVLDEIGLNIFKKYDFSTNSGGSIVLDENLKDLLLASYKQILKGVVDTQMDCTGLWTNKDFLKKNM